VNHISFAVEEGEIFGFLGPNGAGKTTTIKMLNTLTNIDEGSATIDGLDVNRQKSEVRRRIGLVPQDMTLDRDMSAIDNLKLQAKLYDVPDKIAHQRIDELLELVDLKRVADKQVGSYSWGMQKRLEIMMGLVHTPRVLFMDEPTLGLDAQSRTLVWEHIAKLNRDYRVTIFLTTHYLEEADRLCRRISIIDEGRIKVQGTPDELKRSLGGDVIVMNVNPQPVQADLERILGAIPGVTMVSCSGEICRIECKEGDKVLPKVAVAIAEHGYEATKAEVVKRTLNDVFLANIRLSSAATEEEDEFKLMTRAKLLTERA